MTSSSSYRQSKRAMFLCLLALFPPGVVASPAMAPLQQGPVQSTPAGKSVPVSVTIAEADEIIEVRLYFKTMAATDYFFMPMTGSSKGIFTASLPPVKNGTRGIDYLLLFKNNLGETRKTKPFRLLVLNNYNVPPPSPGEFEILTEQSAPEEENREFAVPLKIVTTPEPLLAYAVEDPYPLRVTPGPDHGKNIFSGLSDLRGVSFSIKIGGVGLFYK